MRLKRSEGYGNNRLAYIGHRPQGMDKDCIGNKGTEWNVVLEKKEEKE